MKILVTGGAGYIGSHTCIALLGAGHEVVIADNLSNSSKEVINRIEELSGKSVTFYAYDLCDKSLIEDIFSKEKLDAVIHFAALKAVGESVEKPLEYYENNLISTLNLLDIMRKHDVQRLIFSSSATVYGSPEKLPVTEDMPLSWLNPYGATKVMIEQFLKDLAYADKSFKAVMLRYFNPAGAHKSGRIGEDPNGIPNNIFPFVSQFAMGKREKLIIFGNDYPTPDGTCIRDYVHVMDLAEGHVAALKAFDNEDSNAHVYNLGTGKGSSVLDIINSFSKACGKELKYEIGARRPNNADAPSSYADCSKAERELGWKAKRNLDEMCEDSWRWQTENPNGYNA